MMAEQILTTEEILSEMIDQWEPTDKRRCANCLHARVDGEPETPTAHCRRLFGDRVPLIRLIRPHRPMGFRQATNCPHWDVA
jgi:hypothetical protein